MVCIWCRCAEASDEDRAVTLLQALTEDGDAVELLLTGATERPNPLGRRDARQLIADHRPQALIWIGGALELGTLQAARDAGLCTVLANMTLSSLEPLGGFLQRGRVRGALEATAAVFTRDTRTAAAFRQAGAHRMHAATLLEPPVTVLSHDEEDRRDIAEALNSRSVWLACGVRDADVPHLAEAHRQATRRSHRLLLVAQPEDPAACDLLTARFTGDFRQITRASVDPVPQEAAQIHVADRSGDLGLWLRLASVTLAGGTLSGGPAQDPFEIATLGSGLLHGPRTDPHGARYDRLDAAGATRQVSDWSALGGAVEDLLAADKVARMVTAGWDVTSRGAQTASAIADILRERVEALA